jgi:hypothetical protein
VLFRYGSADIRLTVDERNWGRDQRLYSSGREDERPVRRHTESVTRHDEQDAAHGREDRCWLESLGWVLRVLSRFILVCPTFLR